MDAFSQYVDSKIKEWGDDLPRKKAKLLDGIIARQHIPWVTTPQLTQGIATLNQMYSSLSDSPLKSFIGNHCLFLLKPLVGYTQVPIVMVDPRYLATHPNTIQLGNSKSVSYTQKFKEFCGVYVFFNTGDKVHQCGSNLDFQVRMGLHYQGVKHNPKPFYSDAVAKRGGLSAYTWNPIVRVPNYVSEFRALGHTLTEPELFILTAFVWQYIRSLEQAITTFAKPTYWKGIDIAIWHIRWAPGFSFSRLGMATHWETKDGSVFLATSVKLAAKQLGLSHRSITRSANGREPYWIHSPKFGLVTITIDNYPTLRIMDFNYTKPFNDKVDIAKLTPKLYYLYDEDFNQLNLGPFSSISQVNAALGTEGRQNWRWVNRLHMIQAPNLGTGIAIYIVCNSQSQSCPMILTNMTTGEVFQMSSQALAAIKVYGTKRPFSSYTFRDYILPGKPITIRDVSWKIQYANPEHHAKALIKYPARKH